MQTQTNQRKPVKLQLVWTEPMGTGFVAMPTRTPLKNIKFKILYNILPNNFLLKSIFKTKKYKETKQLVYFLKTFILTVLSSF